MQVGIMKTRDDCFPFAIDEPGLISLKSFIIVPLANCHNTVPTHGNELGSGIRFLHCDHIRIEENVIGTTFGHHGV